jgi:hypothetical protein
LEFWGWGTILKPPQPAGTRVVYPYIIKETNMATLVSPLFWNMKIKIAILTLATFAALC